MNENLNPNDDHFTAEEQDIEKVLRPLSFDDFAGQDQVLENLTDIRGSRRRTRRSFGSYAVSWTPRS